MKDSRKYEPQFQPGQTVTLGRYGQTLQVIEADAGKVNCVNLKTGVQTTHSARELYKL